MKVLLLMTSLLVLVACSQGDETPPPDPKVNEAQTERVPEDNAFHDQVAALEKTKQAAKAQEERQNKMHESIEEATGDADDRPR